MSRGEAVPVMQVGSQCPMPDPKHTRSGLLLLLPLLPGLGALLLLAFVLVANALIVERELAQRAHFRVAQYASVFADQLSRVVSKRVSELQFVGHHLSQDPAADTTETTGELAYLRRQIPSYVWIGWAGADGRLRAASPSQVGIAMGDLVLRTDQLQHAMPQLVALSAFAASASFASTDPLAVLIVPLPAIAGSVPGALVAVLSRPYFETMRQFALGDEQARRSLELSLLAPDQGVVLGPQREASDMLRSSVALRGVDTTLEGGWTVLSTQPQSAATLPAQRFQNSLLYWGLPAALLIGLIGVWTSRRLARPYQTVLDAATHSAPDGQSAQVPGAFLRAVADAMRRLSPVWKVDHATQAFLDHLMQDAEQLQNVLDRLPSPVYLLDSAERVTFWNRQAEEMFEWTAAEAVGQPIGQLLPGDVHAEKVDDTADDSPQTIEARTATRQGHECWGEWHLLPLLAPDGGVQGQIVVVRDITDRVRAAVRMARQQDELAELNLRLMQQEQETTARLAQTLHDQLGQTLGAMRLAFDSLLPLWAQADEPRHRARAQRLSQMIDQAITEVRQALVELRPPLLEELGLPAALDNEVQMRRGEVLPAILSLTVDWQTAQTRWPADVERAAFMITREAIANAARHAQAQHIRLSLSGDAQGLRLVIEDDGRGMPDSGHTQPPGHLGLVGMRERALAIGARLELEPAEPHGLKVCLLWPAHPATLLRHDTIPRS